MVSYINMPRVLIVRWCGCCQELAQRRYKVLAIADMCAWLKIPRMHRDLISKVWRSYRPLEIKATFGFSQLNF